MKWMKRILVGTLVIIVILVSLCVIVDITTEYSSAAELERLFLENESDFRRAAEVLSNVFLRYDNSINIHTENFYANSSDDLIFVEQIDTLYFVSFYKPYPEEEYVNMYNAVDRLFSSLELCAIAGGQEEITFCASLSYGVECDIIYTADGTPPTIRHTIKEQVKICDGWYAVISHD